MIITKNMWNDFLKCLSTEAMGDEFDSTPAGGSSDGDAEINGGSDEQFNEGNSDFDLDMGGGDFGMGDDFGGSDFGDMSDGDMGGGGQGLGTDIKPTENPFKGQNGRTFLDSKLSELYSSVEYSLKTAQASIKVDKVVIEELTTLLDNIAQVKEVVFVQPVETSLYRYALCAKAYHLISKQLCENKLEKEN
jgi:hypothetical protein